MQCNTKKKIAYIPAQFSMENNNKFNTALGLNLILMTRGISTISF